MIPDAGNLRAIRRATLCLVNRERIRHGMSTLAENRALDRAAITYSWEMVAGGFFSDVPPSGTTVFQRVRRSGYLRGRSARASSVVRVGENLATAGGYLATPRNIVRAWMESPPHRAILLSARYRASGLGVALGMPASSADGWSGSAATYTQDFGSDR